MQPLVDMTEPPGSSDALRGDRATAFIREVAAPEEDEERTPQNLSTSGTETVTDSGAVGERAEGRAPRGVARRDLERIIANLPEGLVDVVSHALARIAVNQETAEHLDPDIWGRPPRYERYVEATLNAELEVERAREELRESSLTLPVAAEAIGVTIPELWRLVERGDVVSVDDDEGIWLPLWQFRDGAILPGVAEVQDAFPGSVVGLSAWMTTPHPELEDSHPVDALARGDVEQVLALVRQMHD